MTGYSLTEKAAGQNITFGVAGTAVLTSNRKYRDFSNLTVIIVSEDIVDENLMKETADAVLSRGCKNIAFCGAYSPEWRRVFENRDRELNGFNDVTGYEDFAVMWGYEDLEDMAEGLCSCWNEVLILGSSMAVLRKCRAALKEMQISDGMAASFA